MTKPPAGQTATVIPSRTNAKEVNQPKDLPMPKNVDQPKDERSGSTVCCPSRFGFQTGYLSSINASITMSGPQSADQVPEDVKQIFRNANAKVKAVAIIYEGVNGDEKIDHFSVIEDA